jgi:hypothetical protein
MRRNSIVCCPLYSHFQLVMLKNDEITNPFIIPFLFYTHMNPWELSLSIHLHCEIFVVVAQFPPSVHAKWAHQKTKV